MRLLIKEFREEARYTQSELAQKLGNAQRNISNWESGASEPDCETIVQLADLFGISLDELFGREKTYFHSETPAIELEINKMVQNLSDTQKYSLLQFLREMQR